MIRNTVRQTAENGQKTQLTIRQPALRHWYRASRNGLELGQANVKFTTVGYKLIPGDHEPFESLAEPHMIAMWHQ